MSTPTMDFNTLAPVMEKDIRKPKRAKGKKTYYNGTYRSKYIQVERG